MFDKVKEILKPVELNAARSVASDPLQKFMFRLTVPGLPSGIGFTKIGGLTRETAVIEYLEGMYQYAHKLAGREKVGEIVCERGMYKEADAENHYKRVLTDPARRETMTIEILDRFGESRRTFKLAEAWFSKWEGSDLDAASDDVAIEKLTIQFEYFLE